MFISINIKVTYINWTGKFSIYRVLVHAQLTDQHHSFAKASIEEDQGSNFLFCIK